MASRPSPWNLGGLTVRELARRVWRELSDDEVTDRAAALAYYFVFALFPTLLFLTALLGMFPLPGLMDRLFQYIDSALPPDAASVTRKTLDEIQRYAHGGLLSAGALGALWASSNGMASMIAALNVAYDVQDTRAWWKRRLIALALTVGFALFILAGLVLLVFGAQIGAAVADRLGLGSVFTAVWNAVSIALVVGCVGFGLALIYYLAPDAKQQWRWVTPGSLVALVLWLGLSFGLRELQRDLRLDRRRDPPDPVAVPDRHRAARRRRDQRGGRARRRRARRRHGEGPRREGSSGGQGRNGDGRAPRGVATRCDAGRRR